MASSSSLSLTSSSSSSPISTHRWKYDVFLSFRGEDTRKTFVSHLYAALRRKGITAFMDDRELERGKTISHELLKAIQDSKISIIVFSRNYASSTWCLEELVTILECMERGRQTVLPVFYDVEPSEVRKQTGTYGKAFAKHEEDFWKNIQKVKRWRSAMTEVANISGCELKNRYESKFIQDFVEEIISQLRKPCCICSTVDKGLIGMDSHLEKMSMYLRLLQSKDVRIIGICGMGGIGKMTIARAVYETMSYHFEGSSFILNIRETYEKQGPIPLQEQLISETMVERNLKIWDIYGGKGEIRSRLCFKKALVVLDDVDQLVQLESLVGDRYWFGSGSRIIITTRDEQLLKQYEVDDIYRVKGLDCDKAHQLFCLKAFKNNFPPNKYLQLSYDVVEYAGGLPLALNVLGSFFYGRTEKEWKSALNRLKEIPNKDILDKLQISFDGLEETEKTIFLDIACFFNGKGKDYVIKILECCGFYPDIGIGVLADKSLITISNGGIVWMHDLLQQMGQEIIQRESIEESGLRSRLWLYKDVYNVFMNNTGTEQVKATVLDSCEREEGYLNAKAFSTIKKLRLLILQNLTFSQGLEYLSNDLRYLEWHRYPFKYLPSTFQPEKLVEFHMRYSSIEQFWKKIKPLQLLKIIDLRDSQNLIKTPDFRLVPNLEKLNLKGCTSLFQVHQSIGVLKRLILLNLKDCKSLVDLPNSICELKSLKTLNLHGCLKLGKGYKGTTPNLWYSLLPSQWLRRKNPFPMTLMLPSSTTLSSLKCLNLSYCNLMEGEIPNDMSCFPALEKLVLDGNHFVSIPASISGLSKLKLLELGNCDMLRSLPILPPKLQCLRTDDCISLETIPNLYEECLTKKLLLSCMNCSKLIDYQGNISMGLTWLKRYLHSLLRSGCQGDPFSKFVMCFPGSGIPGWFNYQVVGDSMRVRLPLKENWYNSKLMGFVICAVFQWHKYDGHINFLLGCPGYSWNYAMGWPKHSTYMSEQLLCVFFSRGNCSELLDCCDACGPIDLTCRFSFQEEDRWEPHLGRVKNWGFRMVYEQDIQDLIQSNNPFQNLGLPYNFDKGKRGRDDYCCDSGVEPSESANSVNEFPSKRLRILPVDQFQSKTLRKTRES